MANYTKPAGFRQPGIGQALFAAMLWDARLIVEEAEDLKGDASRMWAAQRDAQVADRVAQEMAAEAFCHASDANQFVADYATAITTAVAKRDALMGTPGDTERKLAELQNRSVLTPLHFRLLIGRASTMAEAFARYQEHSSLANYAAWKDATAAFERSERELWAVTRSDSPSNQ